MKGERIAVRVMNLLLSAFFAFGILVFLEQFSRTGWPWFSRSLRCWPILLCFFGGMAGRLTARWKYPLLGASVLVALGIMVPFWPAFGGLDIAYLACAAIMGGVLYILGLRSEEPFPAKVAVASLLVYLASCLYFFLGDYELRDFQPLCWCGLAAFCLSLYSFNGASLYTGVHNAKGGESMAIPSGIRGRNLILLTVFLVAAVLIGSLGFLHRFLSGAGAWVASVFAGFLRFMAGLGGGSGMMTPSSATPEPEETEGPGLAGIVEEGDPTIVIFYAVLLGVCAILFFLLAYGFIKEGKNGGAGHRFADWVRGLFRTKEILEYEDDVERTADLKSVLAEGGKRARKWLGRLREKPERFEDMPDDRYRLRFAYKALLKSGRVAGWIPSATPREVGGKMETQALKDMTEAYCAARYDLERDVTPEQAECARAAMQVLQKRGR